MMYLNLTASMIMNTIRMQSVSCCIYLSGNTMIEINKSNSMFPSTVNIISSDNTPFELFNDSAMTAHPVNFMIPSWKWWYYWIMSFAEWESQYWTHGSMNDLKVMVNYLAIDDNLIIRLPNGFIVCKSLVGNALEPAARIITLNDYDKRIELAQDAFGKDN